jgi:hypothetical protein
MEWIGMELHVSSHISPHLVCHAAYTEKRHFLTIRDEGHPSAASRALAIEIHDPFSRAEDDWGALWETLEL